MHIVVILYNETLVQKLGCTYKKDLMEPAISPVTFSCKILYKGHKGHKGQSFSKLLALSEFVKLGLHHKNVLLF